MKLAYVVQRYGPDVRGGAETHCRAFASRLANHGHDIEVFTTCATDYRTWRNVLPPGDSEDSGVVVRRFPVVEERHADFDALCALVFTEPQSAPRELQERWMEQQGPRAPTLVSQLEEDLSRFNLVIFFTYLYYTTYAGLPAAKERAVLHPTAHDEPPIHLSIFDSIFRIPRAIVFSTLEERRFVSERFGINGVPNAVVGVGVEAPRSTDGDRGRARAGTDRYALCLGRIDPSKGIEHICSFFTTYRERREEDIDLVFVGDPVARLPEAPGIKVVGVVGEQEKWDLLAGAEVLIHPSFYESFAISLLEAWCLTRPVVVNGFCDVTSSHCRRSGGGVWYRSYAEFESCMDRLLGDEALRRRLGERGQAYVDSNYGWDRVIGRYEHFLQLVHSGL